MMGRVELDAESLRSLTAGAARGFHGRPLSQEAQPKAPSAAAVPQRSGGAGLAGASRPARSAPLATPLLPNAHQPERTTNEAKEPPAAGDIVLDYVQAGGGSFIR